MFATLRPTGDDGNTELVLTGRSARAEYARRHTPRVACKACQSKKLKCSGHAAGCSRCRSRNTDCVYDQNPKNPKRLSVAFEKATPTDGGTQSGSSTGESRPSARTPNPPVTSTQSGQMAPDQQPGVNDDRMDIFDQDGAASGNRAFVPTESMLTRREATASLSRGPSNTENRAQLDKINLNELDFNDILLNSTLASMYSSTDRSALNPELRSDTVSAQSASLQDVIYPNPFDGPSDNSAFSLNLGQISPSGTSSESFTDLSSIFSEGPESQRESSIPLGPLSASNCRCVPNALGQLESLQKLHDGYTKNTFDHLLDLKKQAIIHCNQLLDCNACTSAKESSIVMLLAVVCEKLSLSFWKWADQYSELRQNRDPRHQTKGAKGPATEPGGSAKSFALGGYRVDSSKEQCSILRSLALVQLRNLRLLLARLRSIAQEAGWAAHCALSLTNDRRCREATTRLLERETIDVDQAIASAYPQLGGGVESVAIDTFNY